MSSPVRDYRLLGTGRPRAGSRSASGPAPRTSSDTLAASSTPLSSATARSLSSSLHTPPHTQPFQPRIVRGTVPPSPVSSLNTAGPSRPIDRRRRGSASAAVLGVPSPAPLSGSSLSSSRHGHSSSLGSSSILHQHLKASSHSVGAPGSHSLHGVDPATGLYPDGVALISFPRPAYVEQSALRRYIEITPYPPSAPLPAYLHHSGLASGGLAVRDRNSRSSFSNPHSQPSLSSGPYGGAPPTRRPVADHISDEESSGSEADRRTQRVFRRRPSVAAHNAGNIVNLATVPAVVDDISQFPTRWNEDDRSSLLSISADGREVHFAGADA